MLITAVERAYRRQRVVGALVGSVVGDALGAPFEFGPARAFTERFPTPAFGLDTEMCGGGGWRPVEWTDDTQTALLVAGSLLDSGGLDEADVLHAPGSCRQPRSDSGSVGSTGQLKSTSPHRVVFTFPRKIP